MTISDVEIIKLYKEEKKYDEAFRLLLNKYQERLYWHIRKIVLSHDDTNDILQDVFVKVWKNLDDFREDSGLFTWLYRIATNESLSFIRKVRKQQMVSWEEYFNMSSEKLEYDDNFRGDEVQLKLQQAILSLPEKQRLVFNMKYFDEMKYEEMAGIMDTSVGALKASYHHAVKKIKKFFEIE